MKKIIILLSLFLLSSTAWALKEITFETQPGFYPAVIPLEFRQDGVTLSIYGTAYPPGYSYYNNVSSFVSTSQGTIISIKLENPTCPFVFFVEPNGSDRMEGRSWSGEAQQVYFEPLASRGNTGRVIVTIDEENDFEPTDYQQLITIYQNGLYNYCKTLNDKSVLLYGNLGNTFVNGDTITGYAQMQFNAGYAFLSSQGWWRLVGHGTAVKPVEVHIEDLTADKVHQYLRFRNVTMDQWVISDKTGTLKLFNMFDIQVTSQAEPDVVVEVNIATINALIDAILTGNVHVEPSQLFYYCVEGFLSIHNGEIELIPTRIRRQGRYMSDDINGDGEVTVSDVNALIDFILNRDS